MTLLEQVEARTNTRPRNLPDLVLALSHIPYGRPRNLTPNGVVTEWRGTCSTKHLLLKALIDEGWPTHRTDLWNRVYRLTKHEAADRWGDDVAATVPADGLIDVHTYAVVDTTIDVVRVDVTFPIDEWDGRTDLPLACPSGEDSLAGDDPMVAKARLVAQHCNPAVREPFIAALASLQRGAGRTK